MADNTEEVGARLTLKGRKQFSSEADRAAKDIDKISKSADRANKSARGASAGVSSLGTQFVGIASVGRKVAGVGLAFGAAAAGATLWGLKTTSSIEQVSLAFTTLLGPDGGKKMLGKLQDLDAMTPFKFTELAATSQTLIAYNVGAEQAYNLTKSIVDIASGTGRGVQGLQNISLAVGQIASKGKVMGNEARQLAEAGVNIYAVLGESMGKSQEQIAEFLDKGGELPAAAALKAIEGLEGPLAKFRGISEKQSQTLLGMWSTWTSKVQRRTATAFDPLREELKYHMPGALKTTDKAFDWLTRTMDRGVARFRELRESGKLTEIWEKVKSVSGDLAAMWKNSLWPALNGLKTAFEPLVGYLSLTDDVLRFWADHPDLGRAVFVGMGTAITGFGLARLIQGVTGAMWGLNAAMTANPIGLIIAASAALVFGLAILYGKLNEGRPAWEKWIAALFPAMGVLMTVKNHLRDIAEFLGIIEKKKPAVNGPWPTGQSPGELETRKNNTLKKTLPTGPFPTLGVPAMATGGTVTSAGRALVGERAPEVLTLPRGARVDPLPDGGGSFGPSIVIHPGAISVTTSDPDRAATLVVQKIQDMAARK